MKIRAIILRFFLIVPFLSPSLSNAQKSEAPYYELFLWTTNGPPTITFKIVSVSPVVWKAHLAGENLTYLTTESQYVDPDDITMPGEYDKYEYGWDCNAQINPVLGRGHYLITVQRAPGVVDSLDVDCYGTDFQGDVIVLYDWNTGAFKVDGQVVSEVNLYDDPDGLQPTPPLDFRCTNAGQVGQHPHFTWSPPEQPTGATITYNIYRDLGDGYHKINLPPSQPRSTPIPE